MRLKLKILVFLPSLMTYFTGVSQDKLVKKDSTVLLVNVTEVGTATVKYRMFDMNDGPIYVNQKSDLTRIEFKNGTMEIFVHPKVESEKTAQVKSTKKNRNKDWVNINVDLGAGLYKSFTMVPQLLDQDQNAKFGNDEIKYNSKSSKQRYSPYLAVNAMIGNNEHLKYLFGFSYFNAKSDYDHDFSTYNPFNGAGYFSYKTVSASYHLLGFNNGFDIRMDKNFHLNILGSLAFSAYSTAIVNGYYIHRTSEADTTFSSTGYPNYIHHDDSTLYVNTKTHEYYGGTLSIQMKMSYDFKMKDEVFGIFCLANLGYPYRLRYLSLGISYYPFKKLRVKNL